jgi:AcrR family transcriptional regulator
MEASSEIGSGGSLHLGGTVPEGSSGSQVRCSTTMSIADLTANRPKRADARRNYDKLIAAARETFAEAGVSASLEEIARRADVGIGTLYRNFPTRQALLEAVYVEEVAALGRSAEELASLPPWDALVAWLRRFVGYAVTKRELFSELVGYLDPSSDVFTVCRTELYGAGEPLLARAQAAGVVRADAGIEDVLRMVSGIATLPNTDPVRIERILEMALDGLRYRD